MAEMSTVPCFTPKALSEGLLEGAAAAIVDERAIEPPLATMLADALRRQPEWSDIPVVVVSHNVNSLDKVLQVLGPVATVLVLERPMRRRTVISVATTALRARRRQYHTRDMLMLTEADRRKNEFLATLGHELRNPLAAIQNAHAVIERKGAKDAQLERPHQVINRQVLNLSRMVDDLLDVSRVIAGKINLEWAEVDLNEIIDRAVTAVASRTDHRTLPVSVAPSTRPALVRGDPLRLEQIFINLIDNAVKYTPHDRNIAVSVEDEGPVRVTVKDEGYGIEAAMLPQIFDAFVQEPTSIARSRGGLGLGLPLVKGFASLHGGTVSAASDGPGRGSTFVVTLPRAAAPDAVRSSTLEVGGGEERALAGRHILVVDDNPDLLEMLQLLLESQGCRVEVAHDGQEGVQRALSCQPEIALVDIGLPLLNGYEVAAAVRAALGESMILVAVSGYGQLEDRRRALEAGFDEHVVKPVGTAQLAKVLLRLGAARQRFAS
jgi:signal transduction histidine kinase/ActR/RegA family two-component response regulator